LILTLGRDYKYNPTNDERILKIFPENMHYTHFWKIVMEIIGWDIETDCYFTTLRIRKEILYIITKWKGISNNSINSHFLKIVRKDLWITTENGLNLFDNKTRTFTKFNTKGFQVMFYYSVRNEKKDLWITTLRTGAV
jgi:ligand-binding sensor domain-containing protein